MNFSISRPLMSVMMTLVLTSVFTLVQANPLEDAQIELQSIESGKKAIVKVWNLPAERSASLKVLNADGKLMYKESFTSAAYVKKFDFSQLPAGSYRLVLYSGTAIQSETFEVLKDGSINVSKASAIKNFKPIVTIREGNQVDVLLENRFSQILDITLKNQKGEVMYRERVNPEGKYGRRLNLSHLPKNHYALNIEGSGFAYSKAISLF